MQAFTNTTINLDPNKKNVLVIDSIQDGEFSHIYGASKLMLDKIKEEYNIVRLWMSSRVLPGENQIFSTFKKKEYNTKYLRKVDDPEYREKNIVTFNDSFQSLCDLPDFEFVFISSNTTLTLPLMSYCNKQFDEELHNNMSEFFDYIGSDEGKINRINELNDSMFKDTVTFISKFSPYAISTTEFCHYMYFLKTLYDLGKYKKVVSIVTDPNLARNFFQYNNIPFDFYYYADDNRGTREFKKLGVAQLQELYSQRTLGNSSSDAFDDWDEPSTARQAQKRTKNVIFAGTVFHEKGERTAIWNDFLNDFTDENSSYFIPVKKNGIVRNKENNKQIEYVKERFDIYDNVVNHPCKKPFIKPSELEKEMHKYKYALVFRCVSVYDSLNPKPYQYVSKDILPFFDWKYDEENLLIPKEIKEKLTIRSASDIKKLVDFYNTNTSKREELISALKGVFNHNEYTINPDKMIEKQYEILKNNL